MSNMDAMNTSDLIHAIRLSLRSGPVSLSEVLSDHARLWHDLGWDGAQVGLWLACLPWVRRSRLSGGGSEGTSDGEVLYVLADQEAPASISLADELVVLLRQAGRPLPLAGLLRKLPPGMVVTEPMLRAAALQDGRLEIHGPLLRLA